MSTHSKNPFVSFANASCGLVADQLSELSVQFDKAVTQSNALFNELASRGEVVEAKIKTRSRTLSNPMTSWLRPLGLGKSRRDEQLNQLSNKVDALIDVVAALAEKEAKAKSTTKAPAKKPATRRTATKSAPKAAASKTAGAKPARKPRTTKASTAKKADDE
ncbi:hypothetical protein [Alteromonas oceanisediminis]|uniref:hypothetical protein n=1 Tax=Alteromonas oceanisediminis TaxID=2836180 RepID=UPI001BDA047B|nr:hypothetical protein [Alteromonas oceanisediminis]MBT0587452.1 hypothetical protein [Alteromonas oceanisediminis]